MDDHSSPAKRPVEVQLGKRPVESAPASKDGFQAGPWPKGPAFLNPISISEADWGYPGCDLSVGEDEWLASASKILDAFEGIVVADKVVQDPAVSTRPD